MTGRGTDTRLSRCFLPWQTPVLRCFLDKLGCEASVNYYSLNGSTPLVDMLLGVKYELMENEQQPDRDQQLIGGK